MKKLGAITVGTMVLLGFTLLIVTLLSTRVQGLIVGGL